MAIFDNNCPIREFTADGVPVGRCWWYLRDGLCPRHGDVSAAKLHYIKTGKLTDEPRVEEMRKCKA